MMDFDVDPHAEIAIRIWHPTAGSLGLIYDLKKIVPFDYFRDTRYHGYVAFEFQEMYEKMVRELKDEL
jgi:hypothetical protein